MKCPCCKEKMVFTWSDEYGDLWECYECNHEEWLEA